jgi:hypothetical protein
MAGWKSISQPRCLQLVKVAVRTAAAVDWTEAVNNSIATLYNEFGEFIRDS